VSLRVRIDMAAEAISEPELAAQIMAKAAWLMGATPLECGRDNALSLIGADDLAVGHIWLEELVDD